MCQDAKAGCQNTVTRSLLFVEFERELRVCGLFLFGKGLLFYLFNECMRYALLANKHKLITRLERRAVPERMSLPQYFFFFLSRRVRRDIHRTFNLSIAARLEKIYRTLSILRVFIDISAVLSACFSQLC